MGSFGVNKAPSSCPSNGSFTLPEPRPRLRPLNRVQNPMPSASVSVSVQCVYLQTILYNPFLIGLGVGLSHCQCDNTIRSNSLFTPHGTGTGNGIGTNGSQILYTEMFTLVPDRESIHTHCLLYWESWSLHLSQSCCLLTVPILFPVLVSVLFPLPV